MATNVALVFLLDCAGLGVHTREFKSHGNQSSCVSLTDIVLIHES